MSLIELAKVFRFCCGEESRGCNGPKTSCFSTGFLRDIYVAYSISAWSRVFASSARVQTFVDRACAFGRRTSACKLLTSPLVVESRSRATGFAVARMHTHTYCSDSRRLDVCLRHSRYTQLRLRFGDCWLSGLKRSRTRWGFVWNACALLVSGLIALTFVAYRVRASCYSGANPSLPAYSCFFFSSTSCRNARLMRPSSHRREMTAVVRIQRGNPRVMNTEW